MFDCLGMKHDCQMLEAVPIELGRDFHKSRLSRWPPFILANGAAIPSSLAIPLAGWYTQVVYDSRIDTASPLQMLGWCIYYQAGKNILVLLSLFKES